MPLLAAAACALVAEVARRADAQVVPADPNYPPAIARPVFCSVPNYRYYRFVPTKARGFVPIGPNDPLYCGLPYGQPDGCMCASPQDCRSGYCVPDPTTGVGLCAFPMVQVAEVEFWRSGQKVPTTKVPDNMHDAFRVVNGVDVMQVWGVWELEFYNDTGCQNRMTGGTPIASSERLRDFGHSIDQTAPLGAQNTPRTYWQSTFETVEVLDMAGPARLAFDGNISSNWWPTCQSPCVARTEWIGLNFAAARPVNGPRCIRIIQDKDKDYASFSLILQGRRIGGDWETFTTFNAATWRYGGVWEQLSVPQGVAFVASVGHAYALDGDLNSSTVELVGTPLVFDFGVEVEIDAWRWATALEPSENVSAIYDGFGCDRDGRCPRDPARWRLEGSLDFANWTVLQNQITDFSAPYNRMRFVDFQPVYHTVRLGLSDIWPDGRGRCAKRR